jgi:protein gp37
MQMTIISWANFSWNPIHGCSKVSDGCKFCYAETLSRKYRWTAKPWTLQNEGENVLMKPHKLDEPYKLKGNQRVFVNSMSDMFHAAIPDWYRAVIFCVMLDNPQHVFQVLTKRADDLIDWPERFVEALHTDEFADFRDNKANKHVKASLSKLWDSPWAKHIWQGVSVEDARVLYRIESLKLSEAKVKFISAEPLLGAWGDVDLSGIDWVIVGGESGQHMKDNPDRWMKMEWAREIRDLCAKSKTAYFFKQDSAVRTETRPYLVEADGSMWLWHQYPGDMSAPVEVDAKGQPLAVDLPDYDMPWEMYASSVQGNTESTPNTPPQPTTRVVSFRDVKEHWDQRAQQWDSSDYVYIGRANAHYNLPESAWKNPFHINPATPRDESIRRFRAYITPLLTSGALNIETLRGKTLVCWCTHDGKGYNCHGDVLLNLLGEYVPVMDDPQPVEIAQQLVLL